MRRYDNNNTNNKQRSITQHEIRGTKTSQPMILKLLKYAQIFLAGFFVANLINSPSSFSEFSADHLLINPAEFSSSSFTYTTTTNAETPVVIISALRPDYLERVMGSINDQHPNTPKFIGNSSRYVFIHRHEKNDKKNSYELVIKLAKKYNYTTVEFQGLYNSKLRMNVNANLGWYRMMQHLFYKLDVQEAFIVEDDVILAPDALMMAARLLREKRRRTDVHSISMGFGRNMINPDPNTFLAARHRNFQPMAYSMDAVLFRKLDEKKKQHLMDRPIEEHMPDWTEEITKSGFIKNCTFMRPSVSRIHHIGAIGMGGSGEGNQVRIISEDRAWDYWQQTLVQPNHTITDMYLEPKSLTDEFGFICYPLRLTCNKFIADEWFYSNKVNQPNSIPRVIQTTHMIPAGAILGPQLHIVHAKSSTVANLNHPPSLAVDGDMHTRWIGKHQLAKRQKVGKNDQKEPGGGAVSAWIRVDVGNPSNISSISIHWEHAFATKYNIQASMDLKTFSTVRTVEDGQGMEDFFSFQEPLPFARYIQFNCLETNISSWGYSIWEIIVRGAKQG